MTTTYDVIIIGAGISGVNAAYRVKSELPGATYCILENRAQVGGTWDFFKYPGIRSDSDLHTFGFPWRPWSEQKAIASGASISKYIRETVVEEGIDAHIKFEHKVEASNWSSEDQCWTCTALHKGARKQFVGKFIIMASGYYDYENPLAAVIPGIDTFKGQVIHPQFWPDKLDYDNKKIVIIGSGATAVTLLPNLTDRAAKVTMLQRSPGYVVSRPAIDPLGAFWKRWLPLSIAAKIIRFQFLVLPFLFFHFCRTFPTTARKILRKRTLPQLPPSLSHDPHFNPAYNPWEQRLCMCPDGDFYAALREGKGHVVTGRIKNVGDHNITLENGDILDADIIVTATGLRLQLAGGSTVTVDKKLVPISKKFLWKGVMLQDVPNSAFVIGYTNASWTLGADATAMLVTRLIKYMKKNGITSSCPRMDASERPNEVPVLNLTSTYVTTADNILPLAGDSGPWKPRSNYFRDYYNAKFGDITDHLEFSRVQT